MVKNMGGIKKVRPRKFDYDLIVIGSGAGGSVAAHIMAKKGKKVAIVEKDKYGGECPNYGCVPTKSLLQAAETFQVIKEASTFGVKVKEAGISYQALNGWRRSAIASTGVGEGKKAYTKEGIHVIEGSAHFINKWQVSINNHTYSAKKFLIATGTKSFIPRIPGLEESGYITYREAIELPAAPKSLLIIGGGAIGCEFAELFSTFGCEVHLAEPSKRLIAKEDKEIGDLIAALFQQKGVRTYLNSQIVSVNKIGPKKKVVILMGDKRYSITVDEVLVTAGKAPNTDLGLENAGIKFSLRGIETNSFMQTSVKNIYAAGDVTGLYMYMHTATYQSKIAAYNMTHRKKMRAKYTSIPRCIFVLPEAAAVGLTEEQIKQMKIPYQIGTVPISVIGRATTTNQRNGFVKVMASHTGVVLGASIVAPRAGEMIHELAIAVNHSMKAEVISDTVHAFPTWSEAVSIACQKIHCQ